MDGATTQSQSQSQSQSAFDKSRVLDVKPLRTLVPMFPNPPQAPPFVCSSPFGPFPSGFTPFYPFSMGPPGTAGEQRQHEGGGAYATPAAAVPLRSFGTPQMGAHFSNGDTESSMEASRDMNFGDGRANAASGSKKRPAKAKEKVDPKTAAERRRLRKEAAAANAGDIRKPLLANVAGLPQPQREDGNREVVQYVIMKFDGVRRRLSQLEDSKEASTGLIKRADLKAGNILMTTGFRTNSKKRIGAVPGVAIGDIFFFRMEMCVLGLHAPSMAGIDYIKSEAEDEPLAVSIVSSGGYDDDAEDQDVLVYTGQGGGNYNNSGKEASDQKLERGNLALDKSARRGNQIRVVRGIRDPSNPNLKIYVYDGLYTIQDSWVDRAKSGANLLKYRMVRIPGQEPGFGVWQSILKWKESVSSRPGLILPDLTSGAETLPVALVNDLDNEKGPPYFTYLRSVKYTKSLNLSEPTYGCNCHSACAAGDLNCGCVRKNGGDFPYTANGVLVSRKALVYECGPSCPCTSNCKNRVSQSGLKVRLEVFKTKERGWGLRTWDAIRSGSYICEFAGEVIDKAKYDREDSSDSNDYVFDSTRAYDKSFKWNYDPPLVGEEPSQANMNEDFDMPTPMVISAKDSGNIARFMNHSCSPTVFWQPVVYEQNGESLIRIAFFAIRHISPMTELTYDYGISQADNRRKRCLCGSPKCKGYFG